MSNPAFHLPLVCSGPTYLVRAAADGIFPTGFAHRVMEVMKDTSGAAHSHTSLRRSSFGAARSRPAHLPHVAPHAVSDPRRVCQPLQYIHQGGRAVVRYGHRLWARCRGHGHALSHLPQGSHGNQEPTAS
ncbi:hypothetical protein FIBSPDRAFT_849926 [Athelia psychrophila]|uniref:Uncharacterized protein n=1 Tax=Athelia psychrophila TaxID=1759441 RepID=A0A166TS67_9AGAM|nr:hypothetical protein FIBSPDRAFT_849926 [Fibularhizoctonia sp. CBS 109695]